MQALLGLAGLALLASMVRLGCTAGTNGLPSRGAGASRNGRCICGLSSVVGPAPGSRRGSSDIKPKKSLFGYSSG